jgi:hypothetical protein
MRRDLPKKRGGKLGRWLVLIALCVAATTSPAETHRQEFESANTLYDAGRYAEAATAYSHLEAGGNRSAAVYYNLGNAYFKSGKLGLAITAYLRAEALAPRDPDIRANLGFAREQRQGPSASPTFIERWLSRLTLNEWTLALACSAWGFFLYLAATQLRWIPRSTSVTVLLGILTVALSLCTWQAWAFRQQGTHAIVIVPETVASHRSAGGILVCSYSSRRGRVEVLDRKDGWLQVSVDPNRIAWVKTNDVVSPSFR